MNDQLISIQEAARFLGVATKTLRRWESRGVIVTKKTPGGHRRYSLISLRQFKQLKGEKRINKNSPVIKHPFEKAQGGQTSEISFLEHHPLETRRLPQVPIEEKSFDYLPAQAGAQDKFGGAESRFNYLPQNRKNSHVIKGFLTAVIIMFFVTTGWYITNSSSSLLGELAGLLSSSHQSGTDATHLSPINQVLAATTLDEILFRINVRSEFSKNANFGDGLSINGDLIATGSAHTVSGDIAANDTLTVAGDLTAEANLDVTNTLTLTGNTLESAGDLTITPLGGAVFITTTATAGSIDSTGNDLYVAGDFEVDGATYFATLNLTSLTMGGDTVTDFVGSGITLSGDKLTVTLGTSIESSEIENDTILETDLKVSNDPTASQLLSYNSSTGGFTWLSSSAVSPWTDGSGITYLTDTAEDLAIGGTSLTASIFGIDESAATFYFGYDNSANPTLEFEATDGDAGTITFNTSDTFAISGANVSMASGTNISPVSDLAADLGTSSLRWNNLYVANINSNSSSSFTGQATFTYEPTSTAYTQASVLINPTAPFADGYLLGIGVAGNQRAGIDEDGDLVVGYSSGVSVGALTNPFYIYNHGTTAVFTVDTSGNMTTVDNAYIGLGSAAARIEFDDQSTDEVNILSANVGIGDSDPASLLSVGSGDLFQVNSSGQAIFTPGTTGTFVDFALETEWTTGTLINADFASSTTQSGDVVGQLLNFNTNFTGAVDADLTAYEARLPALTQTTTATTTYNAFNLSASGNLEQNTDAGNINWRGFNLTIPSIRQVTGSIMTDGLRLVNGTINTGGTVNLINLDAVGVGAGTLRGLFIDNITGGSGTEMAISINTGWDTDLQFSDTSPTITIGDTGTLTISDGTNTLLTLADSSNAGNLSVTGTYTASVFNSANSTALCWDNSGASEITDCSGGPTADYAELYPTASNVGYAEIVISTPTTINVNMVTTDENGNPLPPQSRPLSVLAHSTSAYAENTIGVTSQNYSDFSSTGHNVIDAKDHPLPVALSGRVPVKVAPDSDPILIGDYLTSSTTPGHAMRAKQAGRVIGMALEKWVPNSGQNTVMVFVNPTWYAPSLQIALDQNDQMNSSLTNLTQLVQQLDQKINSADFVQENQNATLSGETQNDNSLLATLQAQTESLQTSLTSQIEELRSRLEKTEQKLADIVPSPYEGEGQGEVKTGAMQPFDSAQGGQWNYDSGATLSSLLVSGNTNLNNLSVVGTLSNGLLALNGIDGQINALGSTLYLQSHGLGGIDFVNGKVKIDESGNVEIAGAIKGSAHTRGIDVTIEKDKKELKVEFENSRNTTSYAVSVTPNWETTVFVSEKKDNGFIVKFASPAPENSKVDWIVIE